MDLSPDFYVNLKNGTFDNTTPQQMDGMFARWDQDPARPLIVHFHGGLVSENSGMATAKRLLPFYWDAGAYPAFVVWEAGGLEVLQHNLGEIFDEKFFKRLLTIVAKFVIGKLNGAGGRGGFVELPTDAEIQQELRLGVMREVPFDDRSASELPEDVDLTPAEQQQLRRLVETDTRLATEIQSIVNSRRAPADVQREMIETRGGRVRTVADSLMEQEVIDAIQVEPGRALFGVPTRIVVGAVKITAHVIKRFARRRDHGVYATIVEEILREFYVGNAGQLIWNLMKTDTQDAFKPGPDAHGGTRFLQRLAERMTVDPTRNVTLVGHSTGAVYICRLLQAAAGTLPPNAQFDVIFLAPANTFDLFKETLADAQPRIRNIRIFGMQDAVERKDRLVPVVYPHSLLYFVSGVCEKGDGDSQADTPLVGLDRFYASRDPYRNDPAIAAAKAFLGAAGRPFATWSIADGGLGFAADAIKHGDFDNFETDATPPLMRPIGTSVRHILQHGYV